MPPRSGSGLVFISTHSLAELIGDIEEAAAVGLKN